jgi:hypothetical protein
VKRLPTLEQKERLHAIGDKIRDMAAFGKANDCSPFEAFDSDAGEIYWGVTANRKLILMVGDRAWSELPWTVRLTILDETELSKKLETI